MKEIFQPIFSILPQVRSPTYRVPFREKLKWTGVILILYFLLGQIALFGLSPTWKVILDLTRTDVPSDREVMEIRRRFPSDIPRQIVPQFWKDLLKL